MYKFDWTPCNYIVLYVTFLLEGICTLDLGDLADDGYVHD